MSAPSPHALIRTARRLAREAEAAAERGEAETDPEKSVKDFDEWGERQDQLVLLLTDPAHQPVLDRIERMLAIGGALQ